jgi:2-polyprenyl-3-methyl-5-hydroxy-6-metoxy-1,4-benzoquinol methylase
MLNEKISECLICGSPDVKPLAGYEKDYLVRCASCSFVFSGVKPTKKELDKTYAAYNYENSSDTELTTEKKKVLIDQLMSLREVKNVLDVACGSGEYLRQFKARGCNVFGTEYDSRQEEIARMKGITMLSGGIIPIKPDNIEGFDLVIFTEIIEHVNNPREIVDNIRAIMSEGGILYITTPNFSSIDRLILGNKWSMICYPEHISYYSTKTIDALLTGLGFERITLKTENISIYRVVQSLQLAGVLGGPVHGRGHLADRLSDRAQLFTNKYWVGKTIRSLLNSALQATGTGASMVGVYKKVR